MTACPFCKKTLPVTVPGPVSCVCGNRFIVSDVATNVSILETQKCRDRMTGTRLKNFISWFPVPKKTNCSSCNRLESKMNAWGPEKCRSKMPYILAKLKIAAKRRGLPFSERLVRILVERAIDG